MIPSSTPPPGVPGHVREQDGTARPAIRPADKPHMVYIEAFGRWYGSRWKPYVDSFIPGEWE